MTLKRPRTGVRQHMDNSPPLRSLSRPVLWGASSPDDPSYPGRSGRSGRLDGRKSLPVTPGTPSVVAHVTLLLTRLCLCLSIMEARTPSVPGAVCSAQTHAWKDGCPGPVTHPRVTTGHSPFWQPIQVGKGVRDEVLMAPSWLRPLPPLLGPALSLWSLPDWAGCSECQQPVSATRQPPVPPRASLP